MKLQGQRPAKCWQVHPRRHLGLPCRATTRQAVLDSSEDVKRISSISELKAELRQSAELVVLEASGGLEALIHT